MLEEYFESPLRIQELRNQPYGGIIVEFSRELHRAGYSMISARRHIRTAEHLVYWISRRRIRITTLDERVVEDFVRHLTRCRCPHYARSDKRNLEKGARMFLSHLRRTTVVTSTAKVQITHESALFTSFCQWMRQQRGTCDATLYNYRLSICKLLEDLGEDPSMYTAHDLRQFVLQRSRACGWAAAKWCATAVRMFLRFLIANGKCSVGLDAAIPTLAHWRLSSLPRYLQSDEVEKIIQTCDPATLAGSRDRAILLLLARLGLRAGDIVQLRLDDVEWKEAWIQVSGKARYQTRLPLTQEVGAAIADYITNWRPPANTDRLFVCSLAPFRAFESHSAISIMVARAMRRAGVKCTGRGAAHVLRHSAATSMLRQGASLQEIATILRHRSTETTEIYAKVDISTLQQIAQPWPEVESC